MNLRHLGERIKEKREKLGLRQVDIAGALQISAQAVSKWERGENAPDISVLVDLSRLLGVTIEWLLGGTSPQTDTFVATVFCSSLNGFARKAAFMPPRDVADWANSIYFTLTEALHRHDGVPVKYVGDGFLGFFAGADQAQRALQTAKMLHMPDLVVTLNLGPVYLGLMGHPDHARPDIIGETVNTAFLAMPWVAENCSQGIGITQAVWEELKDKEDLTRSGEITVPGAPSSITIFEPE